MNNNTTLKPRWENKGVPKRKYLDFKRLSDFGRTLLWLFSNKADKVAVFKMISAFIALHRKCGSTFMVQYLKESHRLTLHTLSGHPQVCSTFPRVATRNGFPLIIPGSLRKQMFVRNVPCVQLVLSVLTVYRIIRVPPILRLNTITDVFTGMTETLLPFEVAWGLRALRAKFKFVILKDGFLMPITSSAPNSRISIRGASLDAIAFRDNPDILQAFRKVGELTGPSLVDLLMQEIENIPSLLSSMGSASETLTSGLRLGALSEKIEAAGKVRVFAMTDVWTQSVLRPLHDGLLRVLQSLPQDGTYDQLAPIRRLYDLGHQEFWSFDLTAATDRLPIKLQIQILAFLTNQDFAQAWADLLVKRPWWLKGVPLYYSVGQPMGAYSSWGMMALTHHVIVLAAARRVGKSENFADYALLGDDLVIADKTVAEAYLVVAGELGLEINLSKSLISRDGVSEFAKRLFWKGRDLSPLPPKLVSQLLYGLRNLPNVLRDAISRGLSAQTFELLHNSDQEPLIRTPILWEILGPLGFVQSSGLSPFLGDRALTERQHQTICNVVTEVVNRHCIRSFYDHQNTSQDLIDKTGTLIWDGWNEVSWKGIDRPEEGVYYKSGYRVLPEKATFSAESGPMYPDAWLQSPGPGRVEQNYIKFSYSLQTPAMHSVMNYLIEETIRKNTTPPKLLSAPLGPFTLEYTYSYIQKAFEHLDTVASPVPDITSPSVPAPTKGFKKMKLYREIEEMLLTTNMDFAYLGGQKPHRPLPPQS